MKKYALITGASQGLGKCFACELAGRNIHTILVSLPGENLSELNNEIIEKYNTDSQYYETDLSKIENVVALAKDVNEKYGVFMLINNAGIGGTKKFTEANYKYINSIIQVNIMATSILTNKLLPNLMKQEKGYVLNISSMAAFNPIGYKTVYPASKAFIHSFSRGLYEELRNTNVFVSVVNPGAMETNPEITARIKKQGFLGKLTLLKPKRVARYCISRLLKRDTVIMVNHWSWLILNLLPIWIKLPLLTKSVKREIVHG